MVVIEAHTYFRRIVFVGGSNLQPILFVCTQSGDYPPLFFPFRNSFFPISYVKRFNVLNFILNVI